MASAYGVEIQGFSDDDDGQEKICASITGLNTLFRTLWQLIPSGHHTYCYYNRDATSSYKSIATIAIIRDPTLPNPTS